MPWITKTHLALLAEIDNRNQQALDRERFVNEQLRTRAEEAERALAAAREAQAVLERQNAIAQSNAEWLRHQVNLLTQERTDRVFLEMQRQGVSLDAPTIEAVPRDRPVRDDPEAAARSQRIVEATTGAAMFEDMGDEAAAAHGVNWERDGQVMHKE